MAKKVDWYYQRKGWTSCGKASKFMDANGIEPKEVVSASRKLGRREAVELVRSASKVIVAKGKKVLSFPGGKATDEKVAALLGPTGNLRAPTIRIGKTLMVGFDSSSYKEALL